MNAVSLDVELRSFFKMLISSPGPGQSLAAATAAALQEDEKDFLRKQLAAE